MSNADVDTVFTSVSPIKRSFSEYNDSKEDSVHQLKRNNVNCAPIPSNFNNARIYLVSSRSECTKVLEQNVNCEIMAFKYFPGTYLLIFNELVNKVRSVKTVRLVNDVGDSWDKFEMPNIATAKTYWGANFCINIQLSTIQEISFFACLGEILSIKEELSDSSLKAHFSLSVSKCKVYFHKTSTIDWLISTCRALLSVALELREINSNIAERPLSADLLSNYFNSRSVESPESISSPSSLINLNKIFCSTIQSSGDYYNLFNHWMNIRRESKNCPMCLEKYHISEELITDCKHVYCFSCAREYIFRKHSSCPLCRHNFSNFYFSSKSSCEKFVSLCGEK